MKVAQVLKSEMPYVTRTWDFESATRYVIDHDGKMAEFSHFRHFWEGVFVKDVVEIASSFGCSVGCHHCAASVLPRTRALTADEIVESVRHISGEHQLAASPRLLVTYSGIGEGSLLRRPIFESALRIHDEFAQAYFVLTTVGIRPEFVQSVGKLSCRVPIKYLQVSVFSSDITIVEKLIPLGAKLGYSLHGLVSAMMAEERLQYRLNYVVIGDLNDNPSQVSSVLDALEPVRERSVLRVSRLNETVASRLNGLRQPTLQAVRDVDRLARLRGWNSYYYYSHSDDQLNCGQLAGSYLSRPDSHN